MKASKPDKPLQAALEYFERTTGTRNPKYLAGQDVLLTDIIRTELQWEKVQELCRLTLAEGETIPGVQRFMKNFARSLREDL